MKTLTNIYRFLNLLSLDVAGGAVVCALFFAQIAGVELLPQGLITLGMSVWIIYSIDHLLDAKQIKKVASTNRHRFYQKHFKLISLLVLIGLLIDLIMILFIKKQVFIWGLGLGLVICIYLLIQRKLTPYKEVSVALLYSAGIFLPTLSLNNQTLNTVLFIMLAFSFTSLLNLFTFSLFDHELDLRDSQNSISTYLGKENLIKLLKGMFFIQGMFLIALMLETSYKTEVLILMAMNLVLYTLYNNVDKFLKSDFYRLAGDMIFFFPLSYILLHG